MDQNMRKALRKAFEAPPPKQMEAFTRRFQKPEIGTKDLLLLQAFYIRKPVWLLSLLLLGASAFMVQKSYDGTLEALAAAMPFLAAFSVMEYARSYTCNMSERDPVFPEEHFVRANGEYRKPAPYCNNYYYNICQPHLAARTSLDRSLPYASLPFNLDFMS